MEERKSKEAPKSLLDYNASWPLTLVYLGFLIGIYFAQSYSYSQFISNMNGYLYYFVAILGGVVLTFLVYNLGKIVFGKIAGYEVIYIKLLGLTINKAHKGETKISYNILDFFTISMQFAPKDDDIKKKPTLLFFGGIIFEAILLILTLMFMFLFVINQQKGASANFGWTFLFAVCYGFLTPLYEMIPLRQDYPTDMFNFIMTKNSEDRLAFNIYQINKRRELTGEDFLIPTFSSYDSFYKLHTLYYVYLQDLYESKLSQAYTDLDSMKYYAKYYLEEERSLPAQESVYLKFLVDDETGANKAYLGIRKDDRKNVTNPYALSGYRTAILVLSCIHSDKEGVENLMKARTKKIESFSVKDSHRIKKEEEFFQASYEKAKKFKPDLGL